MDHQREVLRLAFAFDEDGRLPWDTIIYSCVKTRSTAPILKTYARPKFSAALDFLAARATAKWPFKQFREALKGSASQDWEIEGRRQILNASLNGIRRAVNNRG
jgi:hypothetical protein